ncbi:MAG: hypothetical protein HKP61_19010 [Dactylosporangium sp.]|nr:flippase-like domain-containing protein [Dactylosporangium sp.]NNJ62979.1 hypothetical protein [Dactylosporangium sp.]
MTAVVSPPDPDLHGSVATPGSTAGRPEARRPIVRWCLRLIAPVFLAAVAVSVAVAVRNLDFSVLRVLARPSALPYFAAATAANVVGVLLTWVSWRVLLRDVSTTLGFDAEVRIFFVSFLSKYLPGRVWAPLAQIRMGNRAGADIGPMVAVYAVSLVVGVFTGGTVGLLVAPSLFGGRAGWLLVPAGLVLVGYLRPDLAYRVLARAASMLRRPIASGPASGGGMRRSLTAGLAGWAAAGSHLWVLAVLLGADPVRSLPVCVGGFALATVAGALVVVVPDGWGTRDVLLGLALSTVLPLPAAGAAVLASRLVCVISELSTAGGMFLLVSIARRRRPDADTATGDTTTGDTGNPDMTDQEETTMPAGAAPAGARPGEDA